MMKGRVIEIFAEAEPQEPRGKNQRDAPAKARRQPRQPESAKDPGRRPEEPGVNQHVPQEKPTNLGNDPAGPLQRHQHRHCARQLSITRRGDQAALESQQRQGQGKEGRRKNDPARRAYAHAPP